MRTRIFVIGGVLAVILLMAGGAALDRYLANSRPRAEATGCQSNLKQLALGMMMYAQDYDERYPVAERWTSVLDPYLRNTLIFACPARPSLRWGYAMAESVSEAPMKVITAPAQTPLLFDSDLGMPGAADSPSRAAFRHPGGANVAFVDGHVAVRGSLP